MATLKLFFGWFYVLGTMAIAPDFLPLRSLDPGLYAIAGLTLLLGGYLIFSGLRQRHAEQDDPLGSPIIKALTALVVLLLSCSVLILAPTSVEQTQEISSGYRTVIGMSGVAAVLAGFSFVRNARAALARGARLD